MNHKNIVAKIENEIKRERDDKKRFKARLDYLTHNRDKSLNKTMSQSYLEGIIISQSISIERLERVLKVVNE